MHYGLIVCMPGKVKEITGYTKIPGFDDLNENALSDIIRFTTSFKNHTELLNFLKDTDLISGNLQNGYLSIALFKGKSISILPYGIPYECDKKFYDINNLKFYFSNQFSNLNFMYHFISEFYTLLKNVPIYRDDLRCIKDSIETYKNERIVPTEAVTAMESFVKIYCTKKNVNGKYVTNFLNVHKLVMFSSLYRSRPIELTNAPSELETIKMQLDNYQELIRDGEPEELYIDKINELQDELEFLTNFYRGGRK